MGSRRGVAKPRTERGRERDGGRSAAQAGTSRREGARRKERSEEHAAGARGGPRTHLADEAAGAGAGAAGPPTPSLEFERRELGMCGMRAGMRCAQLREGAGGSGGPATSPSGRRLRRGRGRGLRGGAEPAGEGAGRGRGGGAELAAGPRGPPTLTSVSGSGLSRFPHTNFPFDPSTRLLLLSKSAVPGPPGGVYDSFRGAENLLLSRGGGVLWMDQAPASCPATRCVPSCEPTFLSTSPPKAGAGAGAGARSAGRAAPSPWLPPRDTHSWESGSRNYGL